MIKMLYGALAGAVENSGPIVHAIRKLGTFDDLMGKVPVDNLIGKLGPVDHTLFSNCSIQLQFKRSF